VSPFHEKVVPLRVPVPVAATQGTLALDLQPRHDPPPATVVAFDSRAGRGADEWARRFAQAVVEIVGGDRPVSQLLRWTDREVYTDLQRRALLVARAGGHTPGQARVQPASPRVLSVHTAFVADDVIEASAHVKYGERSRAVASRFELHDDRWLCTALEFA
jgi:hypothetical protein